MTPTPADSPRWNTWERWSCVLLPATLALALGLPQIFGERWATDAPYYQAISMQAAREGGRSWWTLHEGAVAYFNKPPLDFWAHAASVRAFGEVDWAYRAPELLWYVLTCVLVASLARRLQGWRIGLCAGVAMAMTDDWVWRVGNFRLEFLLAALMVGAMRCWVEALEMHRATGSPGAVAGQPVPATIDSRTGFRSEQRRTCGTMRSRVWWAIGAGVCIGLALLTKPLIALVLPALAAVWLLLIGRLDRRAVGLLVLSMGVGLAIALPWHVAMMVQHGRAFTDAYFVNQAYKRAIGEMYQPEKWWWYFEYVTNRHRGGPGPERMWCIYGLAVCGGALILVRRFPAALRAGDVLALLYTVVWIGALCAFSDKRNYYMLALHPGTAWLAGRFVGSVVPAGVIRCASVAGICVSCALLIHAATDVRGTRERFALAPDRVAMMEFVRGHAGEGGAIYNGGLAYQEAAIVYIHTRVWPLHFAEKKPVPRERVPIGAMAIYGEDRAGHPGHSVAIDPNDEVVFAVTEQNPAAGAPARVFTVVRRKSDPTR